MNYNIELGDPPKKPVKQCEHKYVLLESKNTYSNADDPIKEDLFYCERCLNYRKKIRR